MPPVGQRPVGAYAVDAAGNVGAEATRAVRVDNSLLGNAPGGAMLKSSDLFVDDGLMLDSPPAQVTGGALEPASYQGGSVALSAGPGPLDPLSGAYA